MGNGRLVLPFLCIVKTLDLESETEYGTASEKEKGRWIPTAAKEDKHLVELKNVSVTYGSTGVEALSDVSLKVEDGEFAFVIGRSGAGKSTLIKLLLKELDANSGEVYVNGYNLTKMKKRKVPEFRRTIGVVFQDYRLIDTMTVYENIAFVLRVIDAPTKLIRKRVPYVMSLVGLTDKADSYPHELSGGEQQRCALARALVNSPSLLIADEPTGNVDPELAYELVELLQGINACGTTILMVTHAHEMVRHFGGRIINISQGEVVFDEVIEGAELEMQEVPEETEEDDVPELSEDAILAAEHSVGSTESYDAADGIPPEFAELLAEAVGAAENASAIDDTEAIKLPAPALSAASDTIAVTDDLPLTEAAAEDEEARAMLNTVTALGLEPRASLKNGGNS